jgi:hypothetical protein
MVKFKYLLLDLFCILTLLSCPNPDTAEGGSLTVLLPGASGEGSLASGAQRAVSDEIAVRYRYELTFTGPGGIVVGKTVNPGDSRSLTVTLAPGTWDINASAYTTDNIMAGRADPQRVTISPGENGAVALTLKIRVIAIATRGLHSLILKADGSVWAAHPLLFPIFFWYIKSER